MEERRGDEMKYVVTIAITVAAVSLVTGIISRIMLVPVGTIKLYAGAFLQFTNTCLLVAITFVLLQIRKAKG